MDANITIIGAGVIGLAIASELSSKFDNIFVIEKHKKFGQETSSRNSEVIHSGIYYLKDSLKAKFCVEGKELLYVLCKKENIPFNKCGKLIVATNNNELEQLDQLLQKAKNNGVKDLKFIETEKLKELEPNIKAIKALYSPSTGIIDSYSLLKYLENNSKRNNVDFVYGAEVIGLNKIDNGYKIKIKDADGLDYNFSSSKIINCAGLESANIANMLGIYHPDYQIYFCKGEYFRIKSPKNKLVKRLIYPVPLKNNVGLGIHATIDLSGGLKLGPSAQYLDKNIYDYSVNHNNQKAFYESAKKFLPFLELNDISPEMAGIRPKIQKQGETVKDFLINEESNKGYPGFINLLGIESPGLTSALSISRYVLSLIRL